MSDDLYKDCPKRLAKDTYSEFLASLNEARTKYQLRIGQHFCNYFGIEDNQSLFYSTDNDITWSMIQGYINDYQI